MDIDQKLEDIHKMSQDTIYCKESRGTVTSDQTSFKLTNGGKKRAFRRKCKC